MDFKRTLKQCLIVCAICYLLAIAAWVYTGQYLIFAALMPLTATLSLAPAVLQIVRNERGKR